MHHFQSLSLPRARIFVHRSTPPTQGLDNSFREPPTFEGIVPQALHPAHKDLRCSTVNIQNPLEARGVVPKPPEAQRPKPHLLQPKSLEDPFQEDNMPLVARCTIL